MKKKDEFSVLKIRLYNDQDYLIQNYLETKSNKSAYIKKLIMKDMMHEKTIEDKIYETLERFFNIHKNINKEVAPADEIDFEIKDFPEETEREENTLESTEEKTESDQTGLPDSAKSFLKSLDF